MYDHADFLKPKHERTHSRRWLKPVGIAVLALILLTSPVWFLGARAAVNALQGRDALQAAQAAGERLNLRDAERYLAQAEGDFSAAARDLRRLSFLEGIPGAGPQLGTARQLLDAGVQTISAARDILSVGEDLISIAQDQSLGAMQGSLLLNVTDLAAALHDLSRDQKRRMLATFAGDARKLRDAATKIDAALLSFDAVDAAHAPASLRDALQPTRARLVQLRDGLHAIVPIAETIPSALGYPDEKAYLLFFQNNTELRPTGGFLGVVGMIRVHDAELTELSTDDVYAFDGPSEVVERLPAPAPITKYMGVRQWYLRDANWSPDFTVSAEVMERFYREEAAIVFGAENVPDTHGVIAVTPKLAEDVLRLTGPITVRGVTFDAENVVEELEYQVEVAFAREGIPSHERKGILSELTEAVADRVLSFSLPRILDVIGIVHANLQEGHILLSMHDPALQRIILDHDWGGKMHDTSGDYLSVIDTNLASLKSDPAVERTVAYAVTPDGDGYVGTVAITYDHKGGFDWKTTRLRSYTRIYVPAGTEFLGVAGAMENDRLKDPARRPGTADVAPELGRTSIGAFISIEPREKRTLTFRFRLSPEVTRQIKEGAYSLYVEKQPGTLGNGLTLDLDFGKNLRTASPAEHPSEFGDARYRFTTDLRVDRGFTIGF